MKPHEISPEHTQVVEYALYQLMRYLVQHRPSENWSVHFDVHGAVMCQRWPGKVPTGVYIRMKEDAGLDHPRTS